MKTNPEGSALRL